MERITVRWELSGQGEIEIDLGDVEGMTDAEIEGWVGEGAELEVMEQGMWSIELHGMAHALKRIKEEREADDV